MFSGKVHNLSKENVLFYRNQCLFYYYYFLQFMLLKGLVSWEILTVFWWICMLWDVLNTIWLYLENICIFLSVCDKNIVALCLKLRISFNCIWAVVMYFFFGILRITWFQFLAIEFALNLYRECISLEITMMHFGYI